MYILKDLNYYCYYYVRVLRMCTYFTRTVRMLESLIPMPEWVTRVPVICTQKIFLTECFERREEKNPFITVEQADNSP